MKSQEKMKLCGGGNKKVKKMDQSKRMETFKGRKAAECRRRGL